MLSAEQSSIFDAPLVGRTWLPEPLSGDLDDGKVWGRGSADTKCSVMAFFQAVEELLAEGFVPEQDVYLSSSCTEEFGGDGCPKLVAELKRRGVKPYLVCDEGGAIVQEPIGGVKGYYAMLGVLEKGQGNILLTARQAAEIYDKADIRVIPCKTLGAGYYALANLDTEAGDADALEALLTEAAGEVTTGLVSRAIRDSGKVREGEYVGISGKEILASGETPEKALMALAEALKAGSSDVILVFAGADATAAEQLQADLTAQYPRAEVILQAGGQPVYEYILVLF